jgi:hypothetical protein
MFRLGAQLSLTSGREALIRLIVTSAAVAIGVAIMLAVLADFHAFQVINSRPFWEGTQAMPSGQPYTSNVELWNYSDEVFRGQTIERVDVAGLGSRAPTLPGISRLPAAGQYYASPALAALLRTTPRDQLRARFPGSLIGAIGERALTGPDELVVFVGDAPAKLAALPGTIRVDKIANHTGKPVWTSFFRDAFIVGAIAFLLPILILIGTATRLSSARREERYAALRLVGATPRQVNVVASVDAIVSALSGSAVGVGLFLLVRPALAGTSLTGARYFSDQVTPTIKGYLAVLVAVPAASAMVTMMSLRRVRVSPLGVSRKVSPPAPRTWRILPLIAGILLFAAGLAATTHKSIGAAAFPGLLIIMVGLVVGGPWITARAARLLPRLSRGASPIFAAGRLADNPKAAFRSVSGLVLAVFLGTIVAGLIPAVNRTTATPAGNALRNVLKVELTSSPVCGNSVNCGGSPPSVSASAQRQLRSVAWQRSFQRRLLAGLAAFKGATVIPLYGLPGSLTPKGPQTFGGVIGCAGLARLAVLGLCPRGATAVQANTQNLFGDNPSFDTQQVVNQSNPVVRGNVADLPLQAVLVDVSSPATLERVRTFLVPYLAQTPSGSAPRTFGEEIQAREGVGNTLERLVYIVVALTLLVAGCSLAVTVGGGLVERKRPFTLLRVTGAATATLHRVVLLEAVLPLLAATLVAASTAYCMAVLIAGRLAPAGTPTPVPGAGYYAIMGAGLAASLAVILATLPLLGRITAPGTVRFE